MDAKAIKLKSNKAQAMMEYVMMIVVVMAAVVVMGPYFMRGLSGRYKEAGDAFGFGRQYDPKKTKECANDGASWYEVSCYEDCRIALGNYSHSYCVGQCTAGCT